MVGDNAIAQWAAPPGHGHQRSGGAVAGTRVTLGPLAHFAAEETAERQAPVAPSIRQRSPPFSGGIGSAVMLTRMVYEEIRSG